MKTSSQQRRLLLLLTAINFSNFLDRQLLSALAEPIKQHFALSDVQLGVLGSAFELTYPLAALAMGVVADRWMRSRVIALGVLLWSVATALAGAAGSYLVLVLSRAGLGLGCGGYGPAGLALLSDVYPDRQRSRVVAIHDTGLLLGAALGYVAGGALAQAFGWRMPFLVASIPGLALALLAWRVREPARGASEYAALGLGDEAAGPEARPGKPGSPTRNGELHPGGAHSPRTPAPAAQGRRAAEHTGPGMRGPEPESGPGGSRLTEEVKRRLDSPLGSVRQLLSVPTLRVVYAAAVLIGFATSGLIFWMPSFLVRVHRISLGRAGLVAGTLQVAAGLVGILGGGWLADRWSRRHPGGRLLTLATGFLLGTPFAVIAVLTPNLVLFCAAAGLAVACYVVYFPCLAPQIHDVTRPTMRATALAINILLGHVLGNLLSAPIVGLLSDATGDLRLAMLAVPVVAALGGLVALLGVRSAGPDRQRMLFSLRAPIP